MRKKAQKEQNWQKVNDQRAGLRRKLNEAEDKLGARRQAAVPPMLRPAKAGDTVEHPENGHPGRGPLREQGRRLCSCRPGS